MNNYFVDRVPQNQLYIPTKGHFPLEYRVVRENFSSQFGVQYVTICFCHEEQEANKIVEALKRK